MNRFTRRSFIKGSAGVAAILPFTARSYSQIVGTNEGIRAAVVGFNGRGKDHLKELGRQKEVRIAGLCDVDEKVLGNTAKDHAGAKTYTDVRKLLENKEIDAVTTATPNHWHSLIAIWAIQAGKDVYVEKPISHNVWEGRKVVEAARKYKKMVQTGTQCRSSEGLIEGIKWIQDGNLGKITAAHGTCYKARPSIGKVDGPQPIPPGINYDLWCGPAPMEPLMRKRLHYDWHWVWPTGCGDLGNQGIHQMDIARWVLGEPALSPRVFSFGGRFGYIDDGTTPNTQIVYHDYPKAPLIFEVRGLPTPDYRGSKIGVVVDCEGGHLVIPSYTTAIAYDKDGKEIKKWSKGGDHFANWVKAIQSRKYTDLHADCNEGHLSSALCHTGNVSYRLGAEMQPEAAKEALKGDKLALDAFERMAEHLTANMTESEKKGDATAVKLLDLKKTPPVLGVALKMDPKSEKFEGNEKANELLTRKYREPYVVPAEV